MSEPALLQSLNLLDLEAQIMPTGDKTPGDNKGAATESFDSIFDQIQILSKLPVPGISTVFADIQVPPSVLQETQVQVPPTTNPTAADPESQAQAPALPTTPLPLQLPLFAAAPQPVKGTDLSQLPIEATAQLPVANSSGSERLEAARPDPSVDPARLGLSAYTLAELSQNKPTGATNSAQMISLDQTPMVQLAALGSNLTSKTLPPGSSRRRIEHLINRRSGHSGSVRTATETLVALNRGAEAADDHALETDSGRITSRYPIEMVSNPHPLLNISAALQNSTDSVASFDHRMPMLTHPIPATSGIESQVKSAISQAPGTEWLSKFSENLGWMVNQGIDSARVRLWPRELGMLDIRISMDSDAIKVAIQSSNILVRDSLIEATPRLQQLFGEAGLTLANLDVQNPNPGSQQDSHSGFGSTEPGLFGDELAETQLLTVPAPRPRGLVDVFV